MLGSEMEAGAAVALGGEDGKEIGEVGLLGVADDRVSVAGPVHHFVEGIAEAELEFGLGFRGTVGEADAEVVEAGGEDEDVDEAAENGGVGAGAELGCALAVEVHDDVLTGGEAGEDLAFEGAIAAAVDLGVLEEVAVSDALLECILGEEKVVEAVGFARALGAGGAGNGVVEGRGRGRGAAHGGFAGAGRAGDDAENASALEGHAGKEGRVF